MAPSIENPEQDAEKVALPTRPTPARRDALFPCGVLATLRGSRYRTEPIGYRKHWSGLSVRQDLCEGRTAHTKCGTYLLASSLAAVLLDRRLSILCGVLLFPDQWLRLLSRLWYDVNASNLEEEVYPTNGPRWRAMAEVLTNSLRWVPRTEIGMADAMNIHTIR